MTLEAMSYLSQTIAAFAKGNLAGLLVRQFTSSTKVRRLSLRLARTLRQQRLAPRLGAYPCNDPP